MKIDLLETCDQSTVTTVSAFVIFNVMLLLHDSVVQTFQSNLYFQLRQHGKMPKMALYSQ